MSRRSPSAVSHDAHRWPRMRRAMFLSAAPPVPHAPNMMPRILARAIIRLDNRVTIFRLDDDGVTIAPRAKHFLFSAQRCISTGLTPARTRLRVLTYTYHLPRLDDLALIASSINAFFRHAMLLISRLTHDTGHVHFYRSCAQISKTPTSIGHGLTSIIESGRRISPPPRRLSRLLP